jgi:AcrR family transcriptional regulator
VIANREVWIDLGYGIFAREGYQALKIERLAKKMGISKSSFYHHFADREIFIQALLERHVQQSHVLAEKERQAQEIFPDLIDALLAHKTDLLFNRQLRIHRDRPDFERTLATTNEAVGDSFVLVWVKDLNLHLNQHQLNAIFELALENFFLQINPQNLHRNWLTEYFIRLKALASTFR